MEKQTKQTNQTNQTNNKKKKTTRKKKNNIKSEIPEAASLVVECVARIHTYIQNVECPPYIDDQLTYHVEKELSSVEVIHQATSFVKSSQVACLLWPPPSSKDDAIQEVQRGGNEKKKKTLNRTTKESKKKRKK